MSRLLFAFAAFFSVLFRGRLPMTAVAYLPEGLTRNDEPGVPVAALESVRAAPHVAVMAPDVVAPLIPVRPSAKLTSGATHAGATADELRREGALTFLSLLQREARLVDFLRETLDGYNDAAIGAAVRDVHRGARKVLDDHVRMEAVMPGQEDAAVTVPLGFDPGEVRLLGVVTGGPPFRGTLVHHGWRALEIKLPTVSEGIDRRVLAPAEVRIG